MAKAPPPRGKAPPAKGKTPDRAARAPAPAPQQRRQAAPPPPPARPAPRPAAPPPPSETETMTNGSDHAEQTQGTALQTTTRSAPVPEFLRERMAQDVNKGLSKDQADNLIPLIVILQTNSPQANDRNPAYMEGAAAGKIWMRMQPEPFFDGDEGFWFQPCSFSKSVIEWIPRDQGGGGGTGFVGRHPTMPPNAVPVQDPQNPKRIRYIDESTHHEFVEVREHAGIAHVGDMRFPYVIPMAGSNHSVSKGWMFIQNSKITDGGSAPAWACVYRLKTRYRSNAAGQNWFCWEICESDWVQNMQDYEAGAQLNAAFDSGEKRAEEFGTTGEEESTDDSYVDNTNDGEGNADNTGDQMQEGI